MKQIEATIPNPDFSIEKFSGGSVMSHLGLFATAWMNRLYTDPGGTDF